jgi:hypothetical protein
MPFQLEEVTKVTITNANPRRELHGEEKGRRTARGIPVRDALGRIAS